MDGCTYGAHVTDERLYIWPTWHAHAAHKGQHAANGEFKPSEPC